MNGYNYNNNLHKNTNKSIILEGTVQHVTVVLGNTVELPCNLTSSQVVYCIHICTYTRGMYIYVIHIIRHTSTCTLGVGHTLRLQRKIMALA